MASKKKVVEMETHHFVVLGTLTMYTFIDFVAVLSNSILRLYPQNFDKINDGVCKKTQQEDTTMEKINYKTNYKSVWTLTYLPFWVSSHCIPTTTKSLVVTGGQDHGAVS